MNRYIVAVSGGVDSVVLLDMLANGVTPISHFLGPNPQLILAHFDHGIRQESKEDAEFVKSLAEKYSLPFETKREKLGKNASEDLARQKRYEFLRDVAKKYDAEIVTAHHADDVVETIAINLTRGTGWRGLAVMDSDIIRPLTNITKAEIIEYAKSNNLTWREDKTNADEKYLRNRVRRKLVGFDDDTKRQLLGLWQQQKYLKRQIDKEVAGLADIVSEGRTSDERTSDESEGRTYDEGRTFQRGWFEEMDKSVAFELLRHITDVRLTRPQIEKVLDAIKNFLPSKTLQAGGGVEIVFTSRNFVVKLIK